LDVDRVPAHPDPITSIAVIVIDIRLIRLTIVVGPRLQSKSTFEGGEQCRPAECWDSNEDIRFPDSRTHQFVFEASTLSAGFADRLELRTIVLHLIRSCLTKMDSTMLGIV
jgi:hypothetical protein